MSRVPDKSKHVLWQRLVREQKESGGSVAVFCALRRIPVHQFYWWQRRLRCRSVGNERRTKSHATFVPVRLPIACVAPIEIVHRQGIVIRVHDASSLRYVLQVLESDSTTREV